ncbi:L,D-transpeptidase [Streptomyces sp. NPDC051636]|uniref:L,D-transpeptidase n=1 Tax=Streptomyces sp. NPDC051636 TaxID=3365663 RepID=UPI00378BC400
MSDDLTTGLRQLAESGEALPSASGADIRRRAHLRRRRRRSAAAVAGTAAAAAVALTLVLNPGGPDAGRASSPAASTTGTPSPRPTGTPTPQAAVPDARVNLSTRLLVAGGRKLPVSSGGARTPTPTGRMTVTSMTDAELVSGKEIGMESVYTYKLPWVIRLRADDGTSTYLAAMPYDEKAPGNYDITSGWIGLRFSDAEWLYGQLRPGAVVEIAGRSPAGPARSVNPAPPGPAS